MRCKSFDSNLNEHTYSTDVAKALRAFEGHLDAMLSINNVEHKLYVHNNTELKSWPKNFSRKAHITTLWIDTWNFNGNNFHGKLNCSHSKSKFSMYYGRISLAVMKFSKNKNEFKRNRTSCVQIPNKTTPNGLKHYREYAKYRQRFKSIWNGYIE